MKIAGRIALVLAPLALAACAPVYDVGYGDAYGRGYPVGIYGGAIGDRGYYGYPEAGLYGSGVYRADGRDFRSVAERDAYRRAVAAARRGELRDIDLLRQQDRYRRADRDREWVGRDLDWRERERRRAEWRDRRPVGAGPYDRADAERRRALFEERRARTDYDRSARLTDRERARLYRLSRADRIQDRMDRIERMQRRQAARRTPGPTMVDDEAAVRRLESRRGVSETRENFERRARRAIQQSHETGAPVGTFLREER